MIGFGRAFEVLVGTDLLSDFFTLRTVSFMHSRNFLAVESRFDFSTYLFWCNRLLRSLSQFFNRLWVVSKVILAANEDDWETLTEVQDFGNPLKQILDFVASSQAL